VTWLHVERSDAPLILAFPHGGTEVPPEFGDGLRLLRFAQRDTDWQIREIYTGLADATLVWTDVSRSIIDCNRDPSGASLYPGQATTGLAPLTDFDGEPLYRAMREPDAQECDARRDAYFWPYHAALQAEIDRLCALHPRVVVYDCHSIRSRVPRLFEGDLPELNIGTDQGKTCDPALERAVTLAAAASGRSLVVNGRFRGGWTTRHYGQPEKGVHAIQMEIAMRGYLREPEGLTASPDWPPPYDPEFAAPLRKELARILDAALDFAKGRP
jgi:N-formylglutamate deformylase